MFLFCFYFALSTLEIRFQLKIYILKCGEVSCFNHNQLCIADFIMNKISDPQTFQIPSVEKRNQCLIQCIYMNIWNCRNRQYFATLYHQIKSSNFVTIQVMFATSRNLSFVIINTVSHKSNIMKKHWIPADTRRKNNVIMTSKPCDVATSFWRCNDVIIAPCARWDSE